MPEPELNRQQLRAVLYKIAQTYLEVERGLRPPEHLQRFLTPYEYQRHRAEPRRPKPPAGPVSPHDIGRIIINDDGTDRIRASILIRQTDDRWSALVSDLRRGPAGWQVETLDRLERRTGRQITRDVSAPDDDLRAATGRVENERLAVATAKEAIEQRLEQLDGRTTEARALRPELQRWTRCLQDLDDELAALRNAEQVRSAQPPSPGQTATAPSQTAGRLTARLLGARPDDQWRATIWDEVANALQDYRERWNIDDGRELLGTGEVCDAQADERRRVVEHLRAATKDLSAERTRDDTIMLPDPVEAHLDIER